MLKIRSFDALLQHSRKSINTNNLSRIAASGINLVQPHRGKNDDSDSNTSLHQSAPVELQSRHLRHRGKKNVNLSTLFQPIQVNLNSDDINVGAELTTALKKPDLLKILNQFIQKKEVVDLATEYGLDKYLRTQAFNSFRRVCVEAESLPVDLHVVISDVLQGAGNVTDIFPYFMRHAKEIFPHLDCLEDLKQISDLRTPANWYPLARSITRKIIFHAGPTNSGKTYHALERFMTAKSGVYCGPLKLLASEVFNKCNAYGTPCDLITGEERKYAKDEDNPSQHVSCTVEMMNLNNTYEVAVIDEIQIIKDHQRGYAWTRALLGIPANEVHLCGEEASIDLVKSLCATTGEDVEVRKYKRLTSLEIEQNALGSLHNVQPGDCIVCFSKHDIYSVSRNLEQRNIEVAVIYGSLPPGTKLAQAANFNDVNHPCKVMIATDAIGMGLNLHIRRIIFYSLIKPTMNEKGEREMDTISVSSALQIAGRAGRYGTQYEKGYVTTFKQEDLPTLKKLLSQQPETITQAGLLPTADQIELYAFHLPKSPLSNLMDIFVTMCTVDDSTYFMCNIDDFKFLADMIQHVPLELKVRYVFCCAPINRKIPFVCAMFLKFARQFSKNEPITFNWLCSNIGWPLKAPRTLVELITSESVFDVLDLYLWLSYRFPTLFPDANLVQDMQKELDAVIQQSVHQLNKLLKNSDTAIASDDIEEIQVKEAPEDHKGKLSQILLAQGLLTPAILKELEQEWKEKNKSDDDKSGECRPPTRRKFTRKPK